MTKSKHINIAMIGKLRHGGNFLTLEMARHASKYGDIVSGDYLDKKDLPGRKELFHIRYNIANYECEHINAPFMIDNMAKVAYQADVIIFVADLVEGITKDELIILKYLHENNVNQVIVLLIYNSENKSEIDDELSELAILDAQENLNRIGFEKIHIATGMMPDEEEKIAENLLSFIDQNLSPRTYDSSKKPLLFIEKSYYVSDKGLKNAVVAYGFLNSGTLLSGMDLKIFGLSEPSPNVRVRSLQIFGHEVGRCEAGRSVAVLLEKAPKNSIEPGKILGAIDNQFLANHEFSVKIEIPSGLVDDPLIYFGSRQQFEVWFNMGKSSARWIDMAMKPDSDELTAKIKLEKSFVVGLNNIFLLSVGSLVCVGRIETGF